MAIMAIPLVSLLDSGVEYDRPSLNPFCFLENFFFLLVIPICACIVDSLLRDSQKKMM